MTSRASGALLGCALLAAVSAHAQQPALRVYSIADGLKFSQVFCAMQDSHGLIWAGTSYGLARYDGREFVSVTKAQGLPHDSVYAVAEDSAGTVWVLTQEGLARIAPLGGVRGAPRVTPLPAALTSLRTDGLRKIVTAGSSLWLQGLEGIHLYEGGRLRALPLPDGIARTDVVALGPAGEKDVWLATATRLVHVEEGKASLVVPLVEDLGAAVAAVRLGTDLTVLQSDGISKLKSGILVPAPEWSLPRGLTPTDLARFGEALVVSTPASGAVLLESGRPAIRLGMAEGLTSNSVNAAFGDRNGLLWLATEDGLVKVFDLAVTSFPAHPPVLGSVVLTVSPERDGSLLVGHSSGMSRLRGRDLVSLPLPPGAEGTSVWGVLGLEGDDALGAGKDGIFLSSPGGSQWLRDLLPAARGRVFGLRRAPDGAIWASTLGGAIRFRWDPKARRAVAAEEIAGPDGRSVGEARSLDFEEDGTVWIGTDGGGVVRVRPGEVRRFGKESGLPTTVCRTVLLRPEGLFVGTDSGLYLLSGDRAEPVEEVNRLLDDPWVVSLAPGDGGSLWLATSYQVFHVVSRKVTARLSHGTGLVGASTTGESCLAVSGKRLWVGMVGGLTEVDLEERRQRWPAPEVLLLSAVDTAGHSVAPLSRVPHARNSLSFAFRSPTYVAEERTVFEERLTGYETTWSAPHAEGTQRYTNLPAGELVGILLVDGPRTAWGDPERGLLASFAHQLGGALEMRRMRKRLSAVASARSSVRREMESRGVTMVDVCPRCGLCQPKGTGRCKVDGQPLEGPGLVPYRIGERYRLVRVLGEGGMGTVYLAADEQLEREVAIKIIRAERFDDPAIRLRFEREARAMARIQHPSVIALFDSGTLDDGSIYLIMERLTGLDLSTVLASYGRATPAQALSLLRQAAAGLEAAHFAGVVHRDVKPENLFLEDREEGFALKVVDFGLARSTTAGPGLTRTGMVVGTPCYMSPEQARGLPIDERTDIYSLAAVGFEVLTGEKLVPGESIGEIFSNVVFLPPPPVSSRRPGLSAEVDAAFTVALDKRASSRPASVVSWVESFASALTEARCDGPGWPEPLVSRGERTR